MISIKTKYVYLTIYFILILINNGYGQANIRQIANLDDSHTFFTQHSKGVFFNEEIVITDLNESILYRYSNSGELMQQASKKGRGPGEVGHPVSVAISKIDEILFVLDLENQFVHKFSLTDFEHINSHRIDFQISFLSRISVTPDYLIITGSREEDDELVHLYDIETFEHVRSFGIFINWNTTGIHTINSMIRTQLLTGSAIESGDNIIANIDAPYVVRKFGPNKEIIWEVEDSVFPKPWANHIEVTLMKYNVGMYPRIWTMRPLGKSAIIIQYVIMEGERDNWEYWIDIRSMNDGSLEQRFMLDYQMLLQDIAIRENGDINLLFRNSEDYTFAVYELINR